MLGKCASCGQVAELASTSEGSGRNLCFDFQACDDRRTGTIRANCYVVLRYNGAWKFFLREAYSTNPHTKETFFMGYETVYESENGTVFDGKTAKHLADIWGGIVVRKPEYPTDTKPGQRAALLSASISASLRNPRRLGPRPR